MCSSANHVMLLQGQTFAKHENTVDILFYCKHGVLLQMYILCLDYISHVRVFLIFCLMLGISYVTLNMTVLPNRMTK